MAGSDRKPFLDRPAARALALLVLLLCAASLAYLHRDDFFPTTEDTAISDADPAAPCIAERFFDIEKMVKDGTIENAQADMFRQRAEAMCRDLAGGDDPSMPSLPGLPKE